jgi:predicted transposase/invertase (TIGR01784 family)
LAEGLEEGKLKAKIEIAMTARKNGVPVSVVARITGLPEEQISRLL